MEIMDGESIKEIANILKSIVIYQEDGSGREYEGQLVKFTIIMKDGTTLEVGAYYQKGVFSLLAICLVHA